MELMPTSELVASKINQLSFVQSIVNRVIEGEETAINTAARLKFMSDAFKDASEQLKPYVIDEAMRYDSKESIIAIGGYEVKITEMGVKYDFSECNHPRLTEVVKAIDKLNDERKEIEAFLKTVKKSMSIADESTGGEEITIYPPSKKSTTTPVFTFKK
jgi:P2-related tail formation protein